MANEQVASGAGEEGGLYGAGAPSQQPQQGQAEPAETVAGANEAQQPDLSKIDLSTLPQWRALEAKLQRQRDEALRRAEQAEAREQAAREAARRAALVSTHEKLVAEGLEPEKATAILAPIEETVREQAARYVQAKVKADLAEAGLSEADLPQVNGQPYYGRSEQEWSGIVAEAKALKELKRTREEEERRLAALKEQAKQSETQERRATGADRLATGEPTPLPKGLAAIKAQMQKELEGATGNRTAVIRRNYRVRAREAGFNPDW